MRLLNPILYLLAVLCATTVSAHDTWLVAETSMVKTGSTVKLAVVTAEQFPVSENATDPVRVADWSVWRSGQKATINKFQIEGKELSASHTFAEPGLYVIGVSLKPKFIEMEADPFEDYLRDETAEAAIKLRQERGQSSLPGREMYTKCVKTFLRVGRPNEEMGDKEDAPTERRRKMAPYLIPVGHRLEIIPMSDPTAWRVGTEVSVRVLLDEQPANGLRVSSGREGLPPHTYTDSMTTDDNGLARFTFKKPGLWFFRTHSIRPLVSAREPSGDSPKAEWESFWASITFRVMPAGPK